MLTRFSRKVSHGFFLLLSLILLVFSGCQQGGEPQKSPEEVLREGIEKMTKVRADSFEVAFDGNFQTDENASASPGSANFNFLVSGAFDAMTPEDPKLDVDFSGSLSVETSEEGVNRAVNMDTEVSLMLNTENVWFNIKKLNIAGDEVQPIPPVITSFFGAWYVQSIPEDMQKSVQAAFEVDDGAMTPQAFKVNNILSDANIFKDSEYLGTENIKGNSAWHYSVNVDKRAALNAFFSIAALANPSVDVQQMMQSVRSEDLDKFNISAEVWVDAATGIMSQIDLTLNVEANKEGSSQENSGFEGMFHYRATTSNFGKSLTLDIPSDVKPFPLEALTGMMMGASMMNNSSMMPEASSMMDSDSMMKDDLDVMMMDANDLL